jgi:hypothetical protein
MTAAIVIAAWIAGLERNRPVNYQEISLRKGDKSLYNAQL